MNINFSEKLAICYISCGPTYRESLLKLLKEKYTDNENLFYFILTDNKKYFDELKFTNLSVKELKDYYEEFPEIAQFETLIETEDKNIYADTFMKTNYRFPFSIMRFLLLDAYRANIKNILLIVTDTHIKLERITDEHFKEKNIIRNAVSEWDAYIWNNEMAIIANLLEKNHNLICDQFVRVLDACARLFVFESPDDAKKLFDIWHEILIYIYRNNLMRLYQGSYANNDEFILAPIYNVLGLNKLKQHSGNDFFEVNHNPIKERFWYVPGNEYISHTNYEEFCKINNLIDG